MNKSKIVTVLDYYSGEIDVFRVFIDANCEADEDEQIQGCIEERGHHLEGCFYMSSEPSKFKLKLDM